MAGASDPSVAAALDAQAKSIDTQSRTLASQSKILQQICDKLESQDTRCYQLKAVSTNAETIAMLHVKLDDEEISAFRRDLHRTLGNQLESQVVELQAATCDHLDVIVADTMARVATLENATTTFDSWHPRMENSIDDIKYSIDTVRSELTRLSRLMECNALQDPLGPRGLLGPHPSVAERPSAAAASTDGPLGHDNEHRPRKNGIGLPQVPIHLPGNGMQISPHPGHCSTHPVEDPLKTSTSAIHYSEQSFHGSLGNLPKLQFPLFDGDNPRLWKSTCEDYFHMYSVDPTVWIRISKMQFIRSAARWLQSVESQLATISWEEFIHMVSDRFGKDQHQVFLRQLFHIWQSGSVAAYIEEFSQLVDRLNAYQRISDPLYYTMKFVDGLRDDIKVVVMLQRPSDLDTAVVLAQLQEEVEALKKNHDSKWPGSGAPFKYPTRQGATSIQDSKELKPHVLMKTNDKTVLRAEPHLPLMKRLLLYMPIAKPRAFVTSVGHHILEDIIVLKQFSYIW